MRCHNIFLILLLFFYTLSCGNSAETSNEKTSSVEKSNKPTTTFSQKINSKKNKAKKIKILLPKKSRLLILI